MSDGPVHHMRMVYEPTVACGLKHTIMVKISQLLRDVTCPKCREVVAHRRTDHLAEMAGYHAKTKKEAKCKPAKKRSK